MFYGIIQFKSLNSYIIKLLTRNLTPKTIY